MNKLIDRVEILDISIFSKIKSQSNDGDKKSLLAVQRSYRQQNDNYVYLEIGSHLGGTLQPYVIDNNCQKIISIDPRPSSQPDDRSEGYVANYQDNSSERMIELLTQANLGDVSKIECVEKDASEIDISEINQAPHICFIDGEHTNRAAYSDYQFCKKITHQIGSILFHDFCIVHKAILKICFEAYCNGEVIYPVRMEGNVFAIFRDKNTIKKDPYILKLYKNKQNCIMRASLKMKAFLTKIGFSFQLKYSF